MTYKEFKELVTELNTGVTLATNIDLITKIVLGQISRLKLKDRLKVGEITTGGATEFNLRTFLPDFISLKTYQENKNKCIYYFQGSDSPIYLQQTNVSRFEDAVAGGRATLIGRTLKVGFPNGAVVPTTLYVPYFSKYLVLDADGITEKEGPEDDEDTFLLDSIFYDSLVDGVLLYLKRKELKDGEFNKAKIQWTKSVNELAFYQ